MTDAVPPMHGDPQAAGSSPQDTARHDAARQATAALPNDMATPSAGLPPNDASESAGTPPTDPAPPAGAAPPSRPSRGPALPLLVLLLGLAAASLLPATGLVALGEPTHGAADTLHATIEALPDPPLVLVDMDADLGTYAEIRYATRAALADLLAKGARLAFVSFSPEGRAIAVAEQDRLEGLGATPDRILDLGFRAGAEAGLVQLAGNGIGDVAGPVADSLRSRAHGLDAFDLALVVGGGEIGPRSWIEQVAPRVPGLKVAAITPTFLLPEVQPYRDAGQLVALLGTVPDDTAYGELVARLGSGGTAAFAERPPNGNATLVGMLVAIGVLALSSAGSFTAGLRRGGRASA